MTCLWHNYSSAGPWHATEKAAACVHSRAVTHDVTEEEVISIGVGAVATSLWIRGRGDFSRVTLYY